MYTRPPLLAALLALCLLAGCASPQVGGDAGAPRQAAQGTPPPVASAPNAPVQPFAPAVTHILPLYQGSVCRQPDRALFLLEQVLATPPDNPLALGLKGLAASQVERHDVAFNAATQAVNLCPAPQLLGWRALVLVRAGQFEAAAHDAALALRHNPDEGAALLAQGLIFLRQGRPDSGCRSLEAACVQGECSGLDAARLTGQCPRPTPAAKPAVFAAPRRPTAPPSLPRY